MTASPSNRAQPGRSGSGQPSVPSNISAIEATPIGDAERKRVEEALQESEKRFRDFVETAGIALHWVGPDGVILWANQAELDMLGYTRDEYLGHHIAEFHVDSPVIDDILGRLCRGDRLREYEARLRAKDGSIRHVIIDSSVLFENGKFIHTRCFTRDVTEQKRAEQALRESEQRFRVITEASPIMVWMSGTDKLCNYFSKGWLEFVGRTLEEELGNGWAENVHPDDFDRCLQIYVSSFDARRPFEMEYRLRHHTGEYRWILDHGVPRYAPDGTFEGYVGGCLDIHDRNKVREALRESEERYRTVAETASDAIVSIDEHSTILFANSATAEVFGYAPEELVGKKITVLMPEYLRHLHEVGLKRYVETGRRHLNWEATELPGLHKDGREIPLEVSFGVYTKDGKRYFTGFARDITERKEAERVRARLAAIVESSDDAIVSKDLNGIVTSWNPAAEKMFGYTAEEIIGRPITTIIPPELLDDERQILETIGRGERIEHFETVRLTKSGERIEVSLTVSPLRDEAGRIIGAAKIARDVTHRKKAELALRTAEKLASVGRLAATIAHEINNPLEAVTNLVYLAKHAAVRNDVREYLRGAEEELDRIAHLTKQTLGFYREASGGKSMTVGSTIQALSTVYASRARNRSIQISLEIKQDPEIYAIPGEIRQLLVNLLTNSIDAVEPGGQIRVRVSAAGEWNGQRRRGVRLTIADSGPGIPAGARSRLYEPFFTTKQEVGTGLGLWVCRNIVEKHSGSIHMKSCTVPGKSGTVFSVFLPSRAKEVVSDQELRPAV